MTFLKEFMGMFGKRGGENLDTRCCLLCRSLYRSLRICRLSTCLRRFLYRLFGSRRPRRQSNRSRTRLCICRRLGSSSIPCRRITRFSSHLRIPGSRFRNILKCSHGTSRLSIRLQLSCCLKYILRKNITNIIKLDP